MAFASGCTFKLASMARDDGRGRMQCPKAQWKLRFKSADERSYIVYGCGQWALYEGSCNGETNGCDNFAAKDTCDASCRVKLIETGELGPDGEIPPEVLHPNKKDEEEI